jgi:hypothetical protein
MDRRTRQPVLEERDNRLADKKLRYTNTCNPMADGSMPYTRLHLVHSFLAGFAHTRNCDKYPWFWFRRNNNPNQNKQD